MAAELRRLRLCLKQAGLDPAVSSDIQTAVSLDERQVSESTQSADHPCELPVQKTSPRHVDPAQLSLLDSGEGDDEDPLLDLLSGKHTTPTASTT
mmetsp:Transcript_137/g.277  ORF Transcript_137/g.277 Transcript_137/m.277 type:complete len:95 (-) Transcript_137:1202-1486(-)